MADGTRQAVEHKVSVKMPFHSYANQTGVLSTLQIVSSVSIGTAESAVRLYVGLSAYALPITQVNLPTSTTYCRLPTNREIEQLQGQRGQVNLV